MTAAPRRSSKGKRSKIRVSPEERLRRLERDDPAVADWDEEKRHGEKRRLRRLKRFYYGEELTHFENPEENGGHMRGMCPSHTWADDAWREGVQFPPGADATKMINCAACGTPTPPCAITSSGHCWDCFYGTPMFVHVQIQGSTSSVSMKRVKRARRRGETTVPGGF